MQTESQKTGSLSYARTPTDNRNIARPMNKQTSLYLQCIIEVFRAFSVNTELFKEHKASYFFQKHATNGCCENSSGCSVQLARLVTQCVVPRRAFLISLQSNIKTGACWRVKSVAESCSVTVNVKTKHTSSVYSSVFLHFCSFSLL